MQSLLPTVADLQPGTPNAGLSVMETPKPRIRPKATPDRPHRDPPAHDTPPFGERDPPVFTEHDPDTEQKDGEAVLYYEDDCLR